LGEQNSFSRQDGRYDFNDKEMMMIMILRKGEEVV